MDMYVFRKEVVDQMPHGAHSQLQLIDLAYKQTIAIEAIELPDAIIVDARHPMFLAVLELLANEQEG